MNEVANDLQKSWLRKTLSPWLGPPCRYLIKKAQPRLGQLHQHPPMPLKVPNTKPPKLKFMPKISLVTPSFMQGAFIARTLDSVLQQNYPHLEYFVEDGGSSDETPAILQTYTEQLSGWSSMKDNGQTSAINRGFKKTTGEIMAWLNSDDLLLPNAFAQVAHYFNQHPEVDVVYGNRLLIDEHEQQIGRWILPGHNEHVLSWVDFIPQETLFWRRRIWDKIGGQLDESFRFAMDWDLLLRFKEAGARFAHLPQLMGAFRVHSQQKTSAQMNTIGQEEIARLRQRYLGYQPSKSDIRRNILPFIARHMLVDLLYPLK
jgi:glycosyltransferase involved in cell wall biosynthesis